MTKTSTEQEDKVLNPIKPELSKILSNMTEELQSLRLENKDLETQQRDISASVKNKYKLSKRELIQESMNVKSHNISRQYNDFMRKDRLTQRSGH